MNKINGDPKDNMQYSFAYVHNPPRTPLSSPYPLGNNFGHSERVDVEEQFTEDNKPKDWGVVYRDTQVGQFLCTDWVFKRLKDEIPTQGKWQWDDETYGFDDVTLTEFNEKILADDYNLEECELDDKDRMVILWGKWDVKKGGVVLNESHNLGHIQIKVDKRWESKLSKCIWVISHDEDIFKHFTGGKDMPSLGMEKLQAYKRRAQKKK